MGTLWKSLHLPFCPVIGSQIRPINSISTICRSNSRGYTIPLPEDRESDRALQEMYLLALLFGFSCPGEGVSGWPGALLISKSDFILGFENTTHGGEAKHQRVREGRRRRCTDGGGE